MKRRAGATLLEMLIVCGIVSIILVSVGNLIRAGVDYYFYSTTQLEVQRSGLLCLSILTQEFTASTYESVYTDNNPPNPGFVFAISKDTAGGSGPERSPSGNLLWTDVVCYYIDDINGTRTLLRKEDALPGPPFSNNPPDTIGLGYDIAHFQGLNDPGRIMARHIDKIETEELTDALRITMTAKIDNGRNWLEMDVSTSIVPRN